MNLQESIRRILREEDYSPAGKEITPNSIIVHKSNPMFRDKIMEEGLKVRAGECYKIYVGYGVKCKPAIFATNSTNKRAWFDSTYDDDIWFIDTRMIPNVKWYKDRHFESTKKHIVTFQDIPKEAITLKYEGTGTSEDVLKSWPKDSPNRLQESITRILKEETNLIKMIRRRVPPEVLELEFVESLDMASDMFFRFIKNGERPTSQKSFVELTISILIDGIHSELYSTIPEDVAWYDEVKKSLEEYYKDRIKVRYKSLISKL